MRGLEEVGPVTRHVTVTYLPLPARSSFACVRVSHLLVLLPLAMSQRLHYWRPEEIEQIVSYPLSHL